MLHRSIWVVSMTVWQWYSLVLTGEMRIYSNEHVRKFSEAGTRDDFCEPRLIWSVLGWCSYQVEVVTKEDVAPEAVAELGQC